MSARPQIANVSAEDQPEHVRALIAAIETVTDAGQTPAPPPVANIQTILHERARTHGDFRIVAHTAQTIKGALHDAGHWPEVDYPEREAVEHIVTRLARIAAGDPHFKDHWLAIAGYAQLVADRLT